jgi:hypothetical protein
MQSDAVSHASQIEGGTYMSTTQQIDAWRRFGTGLESVIQAYGSPTMYDPAYQAPYQPPQQPHAYYGAPPGMIFFGLVSIFID